MDKPIIQNNFSIAGVGNVLSFVSSDHIELGYEMTILGADYIATSINYSNLYVRNITLENKDEFMKRAEVSNE